MVEPQAVYRAFVGGFKLKSHTKLGSFLTSTDISKKSGQAVDTKFISILINGHFCNEMERKLLSLPVKYGGIGIIIFCDITEN